MILCSPKIGLQTCSKAVSTGFTAPGDPTSWLVQDDKLYIFTSDNVKNEFIKDPQGMIAACSKKWK
ncbi:MAG: hypothetical protein DHS20C18_37170 [Saprospiraceae bacterium]|nr:MAG: hypothetical protein DHS20C18_37170 [Saprospiraceae bacterium]